MDLGSEVSSLEYVEDNEVITVNKNLDNVGNSANNVKNNGSCAAGHNNQLDCGANGKVAEVTQDPVNPSPAVVGQDPATGLGSPSPGSVTKGNGLKKWRRIKREVTKDGAGNVDTGKLLKRGLPNEVPQSGKLVQLSVQMKQKNEGPVSSTNVVERGSAVFVDDFGMGVGSGLVVRPIFTAGTDSENSEDQSSRSSTAASVPKLKYERPGAIGHMRDKYITRSVSGKNVRSSVQRVQQGKVWTDTSKKPRGELVKIEKENSRSSMESDSRSSKFVFMQGINSMTSNRKQYGRSLNYGGNNSDEAHGVEREASEELQADDGINNGDFKDVSQGDSGACFSWGGNDEASESQEFSTDSDPLVEPIQLLQSVQEALEREVQKFREIGKEETLVDSSIEDSCLPPELIGVQDPSSSEQSHPGDHVPRSSQASESEILSLKEKVHFLESKLDEVTAVLKVKEAKVVELEATLSCRPLKEETGSGIASEFEPILRTIDDLRVLEDQTKLVSEQSQMLDKVGVARSESLKLKREAEKLEKHSEDVVVTDETLKLQKSVWKYSSCLVIQLIMLAIILGLVMLQMSPRSVGVVPT